MQMHTVEVSARSVVIFSVPLCSCELRVKSQIIMCHIIIVGMHAEDVTAGFHCDDLTFHSAANLNLYTSVGIYNS